MGPCSCLHCCVVGMPCCHVTVLSCHCVVMSLCCHHACVVAPASGVRWAWLKDSCTYLNSLDSVCKLLPALNALVFMTTSSGGYNLREWHWGIVKVMVHWMSNQGK